MATQPTIRQEVVERLARLYTIAGDIIYFLAIVVILVGGDFLKEAIYRYVMQPGPLTKAVIDVVELMFDSALVFSVGKDTFDDVVRKTKFYP
jgi:hypothetical protein